ncbi:unnamed protein product [Phytophthora fragariaefolia]|uniref:Unnamed protein product n=1 Tax=Phytophthora fragariaefolia TaxID=1490495 RepID=A0A9W6Y085_9STRA|nr:unnamed protein product [Phytophthora fragariaefolia]
MPIVRVDTVEIANDIANQPRGGTNITCVVGSSRRTTDAAEDEIICAAVAVVQAAVVRCVESAEMGVVQFTDADIKREQTKTPDYELAHLTYLESPLYELIREAYADDDDLAGLVEALSAPNRAIELTVWQRSRLHRYSVMEVLLYYQVDGGDEPQIVVPNDEDLRHRDLYEAHDTPLSGHLGREKTYTSVARNFWWPHMYKWVRKYVQTCETCQRVKPAPSVSALVMSLPVPADCWRSVSMDFIFELPADARGHTGILIFVCRLSKMVRLAAGFIPFNVNGLRHPRTPLTLLPASNLGGGEANAEDPRGLKGLRTSVKRNLLSFIETGEAVRQRVRDAMAAAHDRQKVNSDRHGRANTQVFQVGGQVLLNDKYLPISAVSAVGSTKLRPRFIGPFTVIGVHGHAYTLDLPSASGYWGFPLLPCREDTEALRA